MVVNPELEDGPDPGLENCSCVNDSDVDMNNAVTKIKSLELFCSSMLLPLSVNL